MPEFQVEMRWRCFGCRSENLGRYKDCQTCRKAKQGEPFYDAPETAAPTTAQAIVDPSLIAQAKAGPDWSCRYCRSHQRRGDGRCANCGAQENEAARPATYANPFFPPQPRPTRPVAGSWFSLHGTALIAIATVFTGIVIGCYFLFRTRVITATVAERSWQNTVTVERYKIVDHEGFDESRPGGAFDVHSLGERHHHDNKVQDGTTRESYTERVACGEECTTTPVHCTTNGNGFKSCSGGDQSCSTKYCSETRYRDVPRYKNVPVYETWYAWKVWEWTFDRDITRSGSDDEPYWPTASEIALREHLGPKEDERSKESSKFKIVFKDDDRKAHPYEPKTLEEFGRLRKGAKRKLRVGLFSDTQVLP